MQSTSNRVALLLIGAAAAFACSDHAPDEPFGPARDMGTTELAAVPRLIECPTSETRTISRTVGPMGGSLELDGTSVTIPAGAVLLPTSITLTLPASRYMELDLTANALDHFEFPVAVRVSIDYGRCSDTALTDAPASAWYIDGRTKKLLEAMSGTDDRSARRISFSTVHFSGYSIAQ